MTKEEYERLLKSDYWKGYSYSLIKERNFTCEDCGRRFYGERNKLQVHHLVYRDVNPWSYIQTKWWFYVKTVTRNVTEPQQSLRRSNKQITPNPLLGNMTKAILSQMTAMQRGHFLQ